MSSSKIYNKYILRLSRKYFVKDNPYNDKCYKKKKV